MANSSPLVDHCVELLAVLGPSRSCRMFGGHGFYVDGLFVALLVNDQLYLKADTPAQPAFKGAGSRPFEYNRREGVRQVMAYWSAPDEAMESPNGMRPWLRLAMESALRGANSKRPAATRRKAAMAPAKRTTSSPARAAKAVGTDRKVKKKSMPD